jgi:predicted DNA-binding transcriptional regulator AlpA
MKDSAKAIDIREIVQSGEGRRMAGGISKSAWYRFEKRINPSAGEFPRAFRILGMPRRKFYKVADIKAWIAAQLEVAE